MQNPGYRRLSRTGKVTEEYWGMEAPKAKTRLIFNYWKSAKNGQWYWHLKSRNGRIVCVSEGYKRKKDCFHTIELVKNRAYGAKVLED